MLLAWQYLIHASLAIVLRHGYYLVLTISQIRLTVAFYDTYVRGCWGYQVWTGGVLHLCAVRLVMEGMYVPRR